MDLCLNAPHPALSPSSPVLQKGVTTPRPRTSVLKSMWYVVRPGNNTIASSTTEQKGRLKVHRHMYRDNLLLPAQLGRQAMRSGKSRVACYIYERKRLLFSSSPDGGQEEKKNETPLPPARTPCPWAPLPAGKSPACPPCAPEKAGILHSGQKGTR